MAKSWSGMRKYLEQESLCVALQGRVQYFVTRYSGKHNEIGRVAIRLDGQEIHKTSWYRAYAQMLEEQAGMGPRGEVELVDAYWERLGKAACEAGAFDEQDLYDAAKLFHNSGIDTCLVHENPIVRMFAVLDRRVGKKRLELVRERAAEQPDWLRVYYELRLAVER